MHCRTFLSLLYLLPVLALALMSTGCKPASKAGGSAVGPLASNTVIALVNGKEVVAGQIETLIQQAVAQQQQMGMPVTPAQLDQERRKLIEQRIMDALVRDILATANVQVAEVQVDRQIASLISNEYNGEGQLREALEESNMTYDQFREGLRL